MQPLAMHTEVTSDPQQMRWVIPGGRITGFVDYPDVLTDNQHLKRICSVNGVLRIQLQPGVLVVTKHPCNAWTDIARELRPLLIELVRAGSLNLQEQVPTEVQLRVAVTAILEGDTGDIAATHGGGITIDSISDQTVELNMTGACHGCPATQTTLEQRIAEPLRRYFPSIKVVDAQAKDSRSTRTRLPFPRLRKAEQDSRTSGRQRACDC